MRVADLGYGLELVVNGDEYTIMQVYERGGREKASIKIDREDLTNIWESVHRDAKKSVEDAKSALKKYYTEQDLNVQELLDIKAKLEEVADVVHWSDLLGRDMLVDYLMDEIGKIDKDLE